MSMYQSVCADYAAAVVPSDTTPVGPTLGLYIGGAGNVTVRMYKSQQIVQFQALSVGAFLPVQCDRVMAATTATLIVAMW